MFRFLVASCLVSCVRTRCEEDLDDLCLDCPTFAEARETARSGRYARAVTQVYGCLEPFDVVTILEPLDWVVVDYFDLAGHLVGRLAWGDAPRRCTPWSVANEIHYGAIPVCTPGCRYDIECPEGDCLAELALLPPCPDGDGLE